MSQEGAESPDAFPIGVGRDAGKWRREGPGGDPGRERRQEGRSAPGSPPEREAERPSPPWAPRPVGRCSPMSSSSDSPLPWTTVLASLCSASFPRLTRLCCPSGRRACLVTATGPLVLRCVPGLSERRDGGADDMAVPAVPACVRGTTSPLWAYSSHPHSPCTSVHSARTSGASPLPSLPQMILIAGATCFPAGPGPTWKLTCGLRKAATHISSGARCQIGRRKTAEGVLRERVACHLITWQGSGQAGASIPQESAKPAETAETSLS